MDVLVEGKYMKAFRIGKDTDLIVVELKQSGVQLEITNRYSTKAKLIDEEGRFLKQLDPFNSEMMAEYQNTIEFCVNCLRDWEGK